MSSELRIPKVMSTQHPDNVDTPFFASGPEMTGDDEVTEAYYVFSHFGCDEQMWDCEGKDYENSVVRKLLTRFPTFFQQRVLGESINLTVRVPNPAEEGIEAKILLEALESIPRSFDTASRFYGRDVPPVFEVILPMAGNAAGIDHVYDYYTKFVVGKVNHILERGDITVGEWIGRFEPKQINVIPLFEDQRCLLQAATITQGYLEDKRPDYQRVFLARSDPAMSYGSLASGLLVKLALLSLDELSEKLGIPIYPILGVGSAPFRGNLKPSTVERITSEYPSVQTFTVQSAFKYDYPVEDVMAGVQKLRAHKTQNARELDERRALDIIGKTAAAYHYQTLALAPVVNNIARFVPGRRKRKPHMGVFGYSRQIEGVKLPRAITFAATLYSVGVPPELLGLSALNAEDIKFLQEQHPSFEADLADALTYVNPESPFLPAELKPILSKYRDMVTVDQGHLEQAQYIERSIVGQEHKDLAESVLSAASIRRFLG